MIGGVPNDRLPLGSQKNINKVNFLQMRTLSETWRDIPEFEGLYQVSNIGNVRSVDRCLPDKNGRYVSHKGKILAPQQNDGYVYVMLSKDGKQYSCKVHRLVAMAFIPNRENLPYINHKDENKSNNCVDNLEWCSKAYNDRYGATPERTRLMNRLKNGKPVAMFDKHGNFIRIYECVNDAKKDGFQNGPIISCCKKECNHAYGFVFRYVSELAVFYSENHMDDFI